MPRVPDDQYLQTHHQLKRFWNHQSAVFASLSSTEQWCLHDYFQPSKELTDDELLQHRRAITRKRPNLPHKAARALSKLHECAARHALQRVHAAKQPAARPAAKGKRDITVRAVVRPTIDTHRLARALLAFALEDLKKKQAAASDDEPPAA